VLSPLFYMRVRGVCRLVTSGSRGSQGLDLAPIVPRGASRLRSSGKRLAAAPGCHVVSRRSVAGRDDGDAEQLSSPLARRAAPVGKSQVSSRGARPWSATNSSTWLLSGRRLVRQANRHAAASATLSLYSDRSSSRGVVLTCSSASTSLSSGQVLPPPDGETGLTGPTGAKGETGTKGVSGATGSAGEMGVTGATGSWTRPGAPGPADHRHRHQDEQPDPQAQAEPRVKPELKA
jgi:hypothetical protein